MCCLTSAPAAPPPHCPPEPCSNRSPLIVPDELLHFPANVRRGDLRRPGGVISTHSLGCCQCGRRQEQAWIAQSLDWSVHPVHTTRTAYRPLSAWPAPRPLPFSGWVSVVATPVWAGPWEGGASPSARLGGGPGGGDAGLFLRVEAQACQLCCGPNRC